MSRLWDKGASIDQRILEFTVGDDYLLDANLVPFDVQASVAHVRMLGQQGLLDSSEVEALVSALREAGEEFAEGVWTIRLEDEDCHTALENRLTEKLGALGGKVHLGRSRNDQVLVALRLYMRAAIEELRLAACPLLSALADLAARYPETPMPGYTHLQQAMPSSVADWAQGFRAELGHSVALLDAAYALADLNPLGSAAGYGTPGLALDRDSTSLELGFSATQNPVTACQLSRGKAESTLAFAIAHILGDIGRMSADLCLFASKEFGFVRLADEISTGSSIMPQKRNPDVFELLRAHGALAIHDATAILALTSKMTSGYHRDFQLMKGPLFRSVERGLTCLEIAAHAIGRVEFDAERMAAATDPGIHAAEAAFRLVQERGVSFRDAYRLVAASQV